MITIIEKTNNKNTGEKTKSTKHTEFMSDWLNAMNKFAETQYDPENVVWTDVGDSKFRLFKTVNGIRYELIIKWD